MVKLLSHGELIIDIDKSVIDMILNVYPDENLHERKIFKNAIHSDELIFSELKDECSKLHIPWQLFFLSPSKVKKEITNINSLRKSKFDFSKIANRESGLSNRISMRLVDRIIALQQFCIEDEPSINDFCGSLKLIDHTNWSTNIIKYFEIDLDKFNNLNKEKALEYLIYQVETKNIYVSRGVLTNKILPASKELKESYKQSSGFVVQDSKIPYVFLPNEINRNETSGRQIYTLLSLIILIGLGEYNILVNRDLGSQVNKSKLTKKVHSSVTEILLPFEVTDTCRNKKIDSLIRDDLAERYKLTPTAVVITLRERGLIEQDECEILLKSIQKKPSQGDVFYSRQKLTTSVEKFCGHASNSKILGGIKNKTLKPNKAQYLLFGQIDKSRFHTFKIMSKV